jgi:hypothetical protein
MKHRLRHMTELASRAAVLPLVALLAAVPASATQAAPDTSHFTDAMREEFLLQAKVVDTRSAPGGITGSIVATLRKDGLVHDAHVQVIDERKALHRLGGSTELDFRDSWRNNVAAYRLDRLLGLGMVPVSVPRSYEGKSAAFTWWLDDVAMTEKERQAKKTPVPDADAWKSAAPRRPVVRSAHLQLRPQPRQPARRHPVAPVDDRPHPQLQDVRRAEAPAGARDQV